MPVFFNYESDLNFLLALHNGEPIEQSIERTTFSAKIIRGITIKEDTDRKKVAYHFVSKFYNFEKEQHVWVSDAEVANLHQLYTYRNLNVSKIVSDENVIDGKLNPRRHLRRIEMLWSGFDLKSWMEFPDFKYKMRSSIDQLRLWYCVLKNLSEFHDKGWVHCDIRLENICIPFSPDGESKDSLDINLELERTCLIDFGLSMPPLGGHISRDIQKCRVISTEELVSRKYIDNFDNNKKNLINFRDDLFSMAGLINNWGNIPEKYENEVISNATSETIPMSINHSREFGILKALPVKLYEIYNEDDDSRAIQMRNDLLMNLAEYFNDRVSMRVSVAKPTKSSTKNEPAITPPPLPPVPLPPVIPAKTSSGTHMVLWLFGTIITVMLVWMAYPYINAMFSKSDGKEQVIKPGPPLVVKGEQSIYRFGDEIKFSFQAPVSGYFTIFFKDRSNPENINIFIPDGWDNVPVKEQDIINFPAFGQSFPATPPAGFVDVVGVVSPDSIRWDVWRESKTFPPTNFGDNISQVSISSTYTIEVKK